MSEKTVQSVVDHFRMLKTISYTMYVGNVNQFINIIKGGDHDRIREQFYPNKDIQFFKDVLDQLGESYE